jgi:hypothetical protein
VEYGYDAASRVTSITYKQNGTTLLGDLTYELRQSRQPHQDRRELGEDRHARGGVRC